MEGVQEAFGEDRVSDTGIQECTIIGQGIGLAMQGPSPHCGDPVSRLPLLRPADHGDDLATVHYRGAGTQRAPLIVRTRGTASRAFGTREVDEAIIHSIRACNVCVPRNMTEAAGMYNT